MEQKMINEAFYEVYYILNELNLYYKLPVEFKNYIESNKSENYEFTFNKIEPLFDQVTNKFTRVLLSYIFVKYINVENENNEFFLDELCEILK